MSVVIFAGPSIAAADVHGILSAECLPPAAQGDLYRAALSRPLAIGLIDGYFERVPAVWHKEILWALSQGIHVFGSASMGALRAAELAPFGMIGVGAIFEAYRDGILEDDDEVAVAHGPADTGYRAGSDAMVNIRATLALAVSTGVIDDTTAATLGRLGKGLFYAERSYARILELARGEGVAAGVLDDFGRWLPSGAVNQKRADAMAMLQELRVCLDSGRPVTPVDFAFEETLWWQQLKAGAAETGLAPDDRLVLETLARDRGAWDRAVAGALGWQLARQDAERDGRTSEAVRLVEQASTLCRRHGLPDAAAVDRWLAENRYTRRELEYLVETSAVAAWSLQCAGDTLTPVLLQYLRWTGDYGRLVGARGDADRSREKG
jgi:hypothetical protein